MIILQILLIVLLVYVVFFALLWVRFFLIRWINQRRFLKTVYRTSEIYWRRCKTSFLLNLELAEKEDCEDDKH